MHNTKYLGVALSMNGRSEETVRETNVAWLKLKECTSVIYDKRMPRNRKVKM